MKCNTAIYLQQFFDQYGNRVQAYSFRSGAFVKGSQQLMLSYISSLKFRYLFDTII